MITSISALSLALSVAASAFVLEGGRTPVADPSVAVSVRSNDLDFSRPADAEILLERIKDAATQACGGTPDYRDPRPAAVFDQCRKTLIWRAVRAANQPLVTEIADQDAMPMRLAVR